MEDFAERAAAYAAQNEERTQLELDVLKAAQAKVLELKDYLTSLTEPFPTSNTIRILLTDLSNQVDMWNSSRVNLALNSYGVVSPSVIPNMPPPPFRP